MKYFEWEGAVTEAVAELMAIGHSDAAGIVEAQPFYMQQSWGKGMDAQLTAAKVVEAAQEQAEERAVTPAPSRVNWAVRPPKFEGIDHGNAKTDGRWAAAQLESDPAQA